MMIQVEEGVFNPAQPPDVKFYGIHRNQYFGHHFPAGGPRESNRCAIRSKPVLLTVLVIPRC